MNTLKNNRIRILLADDDMDDRFFFEKALQDIGAPADLLTVENGDMLMTFLNNNSNALPDVLFLDLNMPRKNGAECLNEIKADQRLKPLPVIIYSTSLHDDVADVLYKSGAHLYLRKTELPELKWMLGKILQKLASGEFSRPSRDNFVLNVVKV